MSKAQKHQKYVEVEISVNFAIHSMDSDGSVHSDTFFLKKNKTKMHLKTKEKSKAHIYIKLK